MLRKYAGQEYTQYIMVRSEELGDINDILSGTLKHDIADAETMWSATAKFPDKCEADIKVVSSGRTDPGYGEDVEDSELPYVDAVLFDPSGREISVLEPSFERVDGEYEFYVDDTIYRVVVTAR